MTAQKITSQPASDINHKIIERDLGFIKSFQQLASQNNWRIVVSGGYGLDILLGVITRNHGDIDLILYGNNPRDKASDTIINHLKQIIDLPKVSTQQEIFYCNINLKSTRLSANIYYVQTVNDPHINIHSVIKLDREVVVNNNDRFPSPVIGRINDLEIEVENPNTHLADILFKRRSQKNRLTHDQDIKNLENVTNRDKVKAILALM